MYSLDKPHCNQGNRNVSNGCQSLCHVYSITMCLEDAIRTAKNSFPFLSNGTFSFSITNNLQIKYYLLKVKKKCVFCTVYALFTCSNILLKSPETHPSNFISSL